MYKNQFQMKFQAWPELVVLCLYTVNSVRESEMRYDVVLMNPNPSATVQVV